MFGWLKNAIAKVMSLIMMKKEEKNENPEQELIELRKEQARLEKDIAKKQQVADLKTQIKVEKKKLNELAESLHPSKVGMLKKFLTKAEKAAIVSGKELGKYTRAASKEITKYDKRKTKELKEVS